MGADMIQVEIQDDFDLQKTISCGQCFRAKALGEGLFCFVTGEHVLYIRRTGNRRFMVSCTEDEWQGIWTRYFDLDRSYRGIYDREKEKHEFVRKAMDCGRGIRILRQDPWEMLVTFILSQRKSIPAISRAVETLAEKYGHPLRTDRETLYTFPTPKEMSPATVEELRACGMGYRAPYIYDAVRQVVSGSLNLDALAEYDDAALFQALQRVSGVGKKVANCVCLFGYGRMARVPVDVWISRAVDEECCGEDPFPLFGGNAGIIQQYVFYYMKNRSYTK